MTDKTLHKGISSLRNFLKKVKPMYYYVRGWEDFRVYLLEILEELDYRAKFMDDKMIEFRNKGAKNDKE